MVGPHWNPSATEIDIVINGNGVLQVGCASKVSGESDDNIRCEEVSPQCLNAHRELRILIEKMEEQAQRVKLRGDDKEEKEEGREVEEREEREEEREAEPPKREEEERTEREQEGEEEEERAAWEIEDTTRGPVRNRTRRLHWYDIPRQWSGRQTQW
ncbi:vicilin-like seed storage protein [Canna indica]|uniref:Vicilin-like seed storage protein n=1 Tax=Canna indica TaxID=4628 RepID=A0AAQ3QF51_9LILI|nr:vicilin-like seed storage protein [Canna indica]